MKAILHPLYLNENAVDKDTDIPDGMIGEIDKEMTLIRHSLQNEIDRYIIHELLCCSKDLTGFAEIFQHPSVRYLSNSQYVFIKNLFEANPFEVSFAKKLFQVELAEDTLELIQAYLRSVEDILYEFESKYQRYGLQDYVKSILEGTKDIHKCCSDIYKDVFVKIQSQKCDRFNSSKRDYDYLNKSIGDGLSDELKQIMMMEEFFKS